MTNEQLPAGFILDTPPQRSELPSGFILDAPPTSEPSIGGADPDFFERSLSDIKGRVASSKQSIERGVDDGQTILETALQVGGDVVGGVLDVAGEGVSSVASGAVDIANAVAPEATEFVSGKASELLQSNAVQSGLQALGQGVEAYNAWAAENPRAADNIGALGNILSVIPAAKVARGAGAVSGGAKSAISSLSDDLASIGVRGTLGMTGKPGAVIENALGSIPTASARVASETSRVAGELSDATQDAARRIGFASNNADAGAAIQRGAQQFVDETSETASRLFGDVDSLIPESTLIKAPEAASALRETLKGLDQTPEIGKAIGAQRWAAIADELEGGNLSWKAARTLRSDIGSAIGKITGPLADADDARLKLVYGKLSDDLASAANAAGPDAEKAWARANKFYAARQKRIDASIKNVLKVDTPEKAFAAAEALTLKDSARGSSKKLAALKRSMPRDDWNDFSATLISKMGEARAGAQGAAGSAFSGQTFMTKWNKMSPEARRLLMPNQAAADEMNALARSVEAFKTAGGEKNFSNTGQTLITAAFIGGSVLDTATAGAAAAGTFLTGRLLTSGAFVRAMNQGVNGNLTALKKMATGKGAQAVGATALLREIGSQSVNEVMTRDTPGIETLSSDTR